MGDKVECPICFAKVNSDDQMNCLTCMQCMQHMHSKCMVEWSQSKIIQAGRTRLLKDDIKICPVCRSNRIAYCESSDIDINEDIKAEVARNPNRRGGGKRVKRSKRVKRFKQTKKNRK